MAKPSENYPHSTNFQLSTVQRDRLEFMAQEAGIPMAAIVRQSIDFRYTTGVEGIPHCADGARCRCPQCFAPPPNLPTSSENGPAQT